MHLEWMSCHARAISLSGASLALADGARAFPASTFHPLGHSPPRARMTETDGRTDEGNGPSVPARSVRWPEDSEAVRRMFTEYRQWVADHGDPDASSHGRVVEGLALIDRIIEELPRAYAPPHGDILLWSDGKGVVACGALRELEPGAGEIRRIYIRADYRGGEFGRPFVRALIDRARELRFHTVRADTLPSMQAAIEFYQELGFRRIPAFWPHPAADALFFERAVDPDPMSGGTGKKRKSA